MRKGERTEEGGRRNPGRGWKSEDGGYTSGPEDEVPSSDGVVGFGRIWPCVSGGGGWRNEDGGMKMEEGGGRREE